ncbi:hypothetical protein Tco_0411916 [Tanacetum coccineum]
MNERILRYKGLPGDDEANDDAQDKDNQDDENQDDDNEQTDSDNNGDDFVYPKFSTQDKEERDEERFDHRVQTPSHVEYTDDEDDNEEVQSVNIKGEEIDKEANSEEIIPEGQQQSSSVSSGFISNMLTPRPDTGIDSIFTLNTEVTSLVDVPITTIVETTFVSAITLPSPPTPLITHMKQTLVPTPITVPSSSLQDLPNFGSLFGFDHRLKTLETDFSEFKQTNHFAEAVSSIPGIVDAYLANKMHEAVKTAVQLQSKRLRDEAQAENIDFLNKLDDNIKKIIKDQVKEQVKAQTSLAIASSLSELELKKILIEKIESNKSIHRFDEQKNLYKALVDTYESDKHQTSFLTPYCEVHERRAEKELESRTDRTPKDTPPKIDTGTESKTSLAIAANLSELELKKILIDKMERNKSIHRSDEQKNLYKALVDAYESDRLILDTYEPELTRAPKEKTSKTTGKSTEGSKSQHKSAGESAHAEEPMYTAKDFKKPAHQEFDIGATEDQSDKETSQHPDWFQKPAKLPTPDPDWNNHEGQQYPHDLRKPLPLIPNSLVVSQAVLMQLPLQRPRLQIMVISNGLKIWSPIQYGVKESARDVYSKRRIIAVTKLQIVEWHGYKHLDWITVRRDDDKLYTFKEGDFKRLRLQDIEDMLILLVQGKLTNLNVEDRLAFGVSLRMFTRSIVIQRRVEDLQLGVESYQKKLNITKPDTYRSDLKRRDAYTAYSNPRGFIYQNKDKKNKLMRIDELHKFSDGTLDDVRTALNDRLKGIRMEYLPQTIWRQSDRERAKAMI